MNEGVPKKNNIFFLELFFFIDLNGMTHKNTHHNIHIAVKLYDAKESEE